MKKRAYAILNDAQMREKVRPTTVSFRFEWSERSLAVEAGQIRPQCRGVSLGLLESDAHHRIPLHSDQAVVAQSSVHSHQKHRSGPVGAQRVFVGVARDVNGDIIVPKTLSQFSLICRIAHTQREVSK